ncbi:septation protein SepH [Paenarthrobacter sp. PH39-S1]|uniref:septation protein SepH n=1 Tax=Paenarthrobacter sp. PH39-S1 TaxID=3046204 RepID=UPI0024B9F78A|nr:septation protein SepH [Paenarthrobacter sp. PH39-S1]MDJ0357407.1 septation protein SepH [Paenarthrobacter sp. PH39-S1]
MQDLRLVGVHDGGEHLLLSGAGGDIYRLRIDEALRVAASRSAKAIRQTPRDTGEAKPRLSPRDIQMQIRAGATVESIAESSGLDLAHIRRYEGPVQAERDFIARQARAVEVSAAVPAHDGYRSAFGDNAATLDEMVAYRLAAFGIDPASVEWDAWRRPDGTWTVTADFNTAAFNTAASNTAAANAAASNAAAANAADAETGSAGAVASIGEPAPAQWTFSPGRKTIHNANRWAQQLSELEPLDSPLPGRRLTAVADRPFDFEAQAALESETADDDGEAADPSNADSDADGLLDMLRSRRGQRLGVDEDEDDALAALLTSGVPAAHPRQLAPPTDAAEPAADSADSADGGSATGSDAPRRPESRSRAFPLLSLAPRPAEPAPDSIALHNVSTQTREIRMSAAPRTPPAAAGSAPAARDLPAQPLAAPTSSSDTPDRADRKAAVKPKRSSVPSWDEIVFGTKGD